VPTTLGGLLLFVVLLAPGFAYFVLHESRTPTRRDVSVFRETVNLIAVSLLCLGVVLLLFGLVRAARPAWTPDLGLLLRDTRAYALSHYLELVWWAVALLILACILGAALGRWGLPAWSLRFTAPSVGFHSAWWNLFNLDPGTRVYVGCELEDDSYIAGYLLTFNTDIGDHADRELTLTAPIVYRPAGERTRLTCGSVLHRLALAESSS
jgi:hypothetical protein